MILLVYSVNDRKFLLFHYFVPEKCPILRIGGGKFANITIDSPFICIKI